MNIAIRISLFVFNIVWWLVLFGCMLNDQINRMFYLGIVLNSIITVVHIVWIWRVLTIVRDQASTITGLVDHINGAIKRRKNPPPGMLMSIAMRLDHGLGCPGYYDQPIFAKDKVSHQERLDSTIITARQVYEEIMGYGFYSPDREEEYVKILNATKREHDDAA